MEIRIFGLADDSIVDGPGVRYTVFVPGCPHHCPGCHNPAAHDFAGGTLMDTDGIIRKIGENPLLDGVTLSGGEVLMQWQFAAQMLALCKNAGVHTAVESCLLAPPQAIEALLPVTDQFLVDIKFRDPALHKKHLGADNRAILENFEHLLAQDADVLVRTPLIPGYTATDENLRAIARYLRRVAPHTPWELLNFNPLCRGKYAALERDYPVSGGSLTQAELQRFYDILEQEGITNIVKE